MKNNLLKRNQEELMGECPYPEVECPYKNKKECTFMIVRIINGDNFGDKRCREYERNQDDWQVTSDDNLPPVNTALWIRTNVDDLFEICFSKEEHMKDYASFVGITHWKLHRNPNIIIYRKNEKI